MIIFYGSRYYGRIDADGGEYAATRFAHIYFLPLVPLGSMWVTQDHGDTLQGHAIGLSGRSVASAYGRVWGPVVAVGAAAAGGIVGFVAAGAFAAATAWSWRTRAQRDPRERRRSAVHAAVFGTRCDPLRMPRRLAEALRPEIEARWAEVAGGRTPDDVARFGADDAAQALYAYATLRLAARLAPGAAGRRARDTSDRILDATRELDDGALGGGPYRATLVEPPG